MKAQNLNRMTPYVFMAPAAIIMGLALLYPLAYMIYGSFRAWDPSQNISETELLSHERKKAAINEERRLREKAQKSEWNMNQQLQEARLKADELEREVYKAQQKTNEIKHSMSKMEAKVENIPNLKLPKLSK